MKRMRKRDFDKNHERHVKLWDELARTGATFHEKYNICEKLFPTVDTYGTGCFACKVVVWEAAANGEDCSCSNCPIVWPNMAKDCCAFYEIKCCAFYEIKWCRELDIDKRKKIAAQIRDLPWVRK
jgi:hypothetical protein